MLLPITSMILHHLVTFPVQQITHFGELRGVGGGGGPGFLHAANELLVAMALLTAVYAHALQLGFSVHTLSLQLPLSSGLSKPRIWQHRNCVTKIGQNFSSLVRASTVAVSHEL